MYSEVECEIELVKSQKDACVNQYQVEIELIKGIKIYTIV